MKTNKMSNIFLCLNKIEVNSLLFNPFRLIVVNIFVGIFIIMIFTLSAYAFQNKPKYSAKIIIGDFEMLGGSKAYKPLERGFAELLSVAFLQFAELQQVYIVPRGVLWRTLVHELNIPRKEYLTNPKRIYYSDVMESINTDFFIKGTYVETDGKLTLSIPILNYKTKETKLIGPIEFETKEIFRKIEDIAFLVMTALGESKEIDYNIRRILITCFDYGISPQSQSIIEFENDLASFLAIQLNRLNKTKVIKYEWDKTACTEINNQRFWKDHRQIDAVISGVIKIRDQQLVLYPTLHIKSPDNSGMKNKHAKLDILPISNSIERKITLKLELARRLNSLIDSIIDNNGNWQVRDIVSTEKHPVRYLEYARKYIRLNDEEMFIDANPEIIKYFLEWAHYMLTNQNDMYHTENKEMLIHETKYYLGGLSLKQRKYDDAKEYFRSLTDIDNSYTFDAFLHLGDIYLQEERLDDAQIFYELARDLDSEFISPAIRRLDAFDRIGMLHILKEEYPKAIQTYKTAGTFFPTSYQPLARTAFIFRESGDLESAIAQYKKALKMNLNLMERKKIAKEIAKIYYEIGIQKKQEKLPDQAIASLNESLEYDEKSETYSMIGLIYRQLEIADNAYANYSKAIDIEPSNPDYYIDRGFVNLMIKEPPLTQEAIEDYSIAIDLDPKNGRAFHQRGLAYLVLGNYDQALSDLTNAIEFHDADYLKAGAMENLGLVHIRKKDWNKAYLNSEEVINLFHKRSWNWFVRYISSIELGRRQDARQALVEWQKLCTPKGVSYIERFLDDRSKVYLEKATRGKPCGE